MPVGAAGASMVSGCAAGGSTAGESVTVGPVSSADNVAESEEHGGEQDDEERGRMRNTSGKRIFTVVFWARSSADERRRSRISRAMLRMICPIDTPRRSPWMTPRTNVRMFGVSARVLRCSSAVSIGSPKRCS